jgi:hypothetical protein
MSNITAHDQIVEVTLPNPSISAAKWNFEGYQKESQEKTISQVGFLVTLMGALFLLRPFALIMNEVLVLVSFFAVIAVGLFLSPKVAKAVVTRREKKKVEYRYANAAAVIDLLKQHGWELVNPNLNDPLGLLVHDNNPYLMNEEGVRYYTMQFYIGKDDIQLMLRLSDREVEEAIKETEKQNRINFLVQRYETSNGVMSPEKKAGFVAALEMSL